MPDWNTHYRYARNLGIEIDRQRAREIDRFLDKPTCGGFVLPHKKIHHSDLAPKLAELIWGEVARALLRIRKLRRDLTRRARLIEKYRTMFADKPYLEISYESFVANRDADTRKVLQFLGIDEFMPFESDLVKLNPDSLEDIIENYEEVVRALKGTTFEKYLVM